ncbi:MAG TPA: hypothetical protein VF660_02750 [Actinomycetota bacterium]|jgi:hypothetical protein
MRIRNALIIFFALTAVVGVVAIIPSGAQTNDDLPTWQHAVKFVCGDTGGTSDISEPVLNGTYATGINVHNPNSSTVRGNADAAGGPSRSASFSPTYRKKVVVVYPNFFEGGSEPAERPQPPGPWFRPAELKPDWGFEIDCYDIRSVLLGDIEPQTPEAQPDPRSDGGLIKGFVVIETQSRLPLDVTAVYTVMDEDLKTTSEDVETVQPRKIRSG